MKKIVALLLALVLLFSCASAAFAAEEEMPHITFLTPIYGGFKINYTVCKAADFYRVFAKTKSGWKALGTTQENSFECKNLKNRTAYTFTVRGLDADGNYVTDFDRVGFTQRFYNPPALRLITCTANGLKLTWEKIPAIDYYSVYVRSPGQPWKLLTVTDAGEYTDTAVVSGKQYTYTVKGVKAPPKSINLTFHEKKGISCTFVAAPQIKKLDNGSNGVTVHIQKSVGAYAYRYFVKTASGWKAFATSKALSAAHKGTKDNALYTYTVRALGKDGKYVSSFISEGSTTRYFAPPAFTDIALTATGNSLTWDKNEHVALYRVHKKVFGGKWQTLAETDQNSCEDTTLHKDELYTYTLRYLNEAKEPVSFYLTDTKYYYNGALANGKITFGGKTFGFTDGVLLQGLVKLDGKYYFYNANGILQKNGIVGNSKAGFYYADKNGVIDFTCRAAVKQNGTQWLVLNGKAKKVKTEYDKTLYRAFVLLKECTNASMSNEEKLSASFRYLQKITTEKNPRIPHYSGKGWELMYANDIFVNRIGNCMSYGAAFAFMAKAIGYEEVYAVNSGGHGWAEVNHLVYDPEWDIHHSESYYAVPYGANYGPNYKDAVAGGASRVPI